MARIVRFIQALRTLMLVLFHTLKSAFRDLPQALLIIYVFGIVFTLGVTDGTVNRLDGVSTPHLSELMTFWGALPKSIFTLFENITGGISWHEVVMLPCNIGLIKKEMQKGGTAMMQVRSAQNIEQAMEVLVHASAMNPADTAHLTALVQSHDTEADASFGAPAAAVYESHCRGIVESSEGMLDKAEAQ